jgi:hypothetical protein
LIQANCCALDLDLFKKQKAIKKILLLIPEICEGLGLAEEIWVKFFFNVACKTGSIDNYASCEK